MGMFPRLVVSINTRTVQHLVPKKQLIRRTIETLSRRGFDTVGGKNEFSAQFTCSSVQTDFSCQPVFPAASRPALRCLLSTTGHRCNRREN